MTVGRRHASMMALVVAAVSFVLTPAPSAGAATTFNVNSTADPGTGGCTVSECTLREAIAAANASTGTLDTIVFHIPPGGVRTIGLGSALPGITDPVIIDGTTQPLNFIKPIVNCFASTGHPCIVLNGGAAGGAVGLEIKAFTGGSTVKGLVIQGFNPEGIELLSDGNVVQGNYIGTDATGAVAVANAQGGITVAGSNNLIGGTTVSTRNLISGNGTDAGRPGIYASGSGNTIEGNYIGTTAAGTAELGNSGPGVWITGAGNTVGGTVAGAGNLISGNEIGVEVSVGGNGSAVQGNRIGTDASGGSSLGNSLSGVQVTAPMTAVTGNTIAFNGTQGADVAGTRDAVRFNSIYSNGKLGIDLRPLGVTPNDLGDPDTGSNHLQNYPVVRFAASESGFGSILSGTLNSTASTTYTVDLYSNPGCDPSQHGEGRSSVTTTSVATNGAGNGSFRVLLGGLLSKGASLAATATDPSGNTSEFSLCRKVASMVTVRDFNFAPTPATVAQGIPVGWDFRGPSTHTATDRSAMGLYNSGPRATGGNFVFTPPGAGTYLYHCTIHPTLMNGSIRVPVITNPTTGTTATSFKITWAPGPPPSGYVFDVQIKRPGAGAFVNFKTAQTVKSTTFHPDAGTGTYSFRARLRKLSGGASSFSPGASISVS